MARKNLLLEVVEDGEPVAVAPPAMHGSHRAARPAPSARVARPAWSAARSPLSPPKRPRPSDGSAAHGRANHCRARSGGGRSILRHRPDDGRRGRARDLAPGDRSARPEFAHPGAAASESAGTLPGGVWPSAFARGQRSRPRGARGRQAAERRGSGARPRPGEQRPR